MEKIELSNVKEKFSNTRETCPGMSEEMYALTDYIATVVNDNLVPIGLVMCMACVMDDLTKGRNGFNIEKAFPAYLKQNKNQIIAQMAYIPQIVDNIADENFAIEFRKTYKEMLGFDCPKRVDTKYKTEYPEYIEIATDWWANAIQSPKFDNGDNINPLLLVMLSGSRKERSADEIKKFKDCLAKDISEEINKYESCSLDVDYHPCPILSKAGNLIGLNGMIDFPIKTNMQISKDSVTVSEGYGAERKTLYSSQNVKTKKKIPSFNDKI